MSIVPPMGFTLRELAREASREAAMRRSVYERQVLSGRLHRAVADRQRDMMLSIASVPGELADNAGEPHAPQPDDHVRGEGGRMNKHARIPDLNAATRRALVESCKGGPVRGADPFEHFSLGMAVRNVVRRHEPERYTDEQLDKYWPLWYDRARKGRV